MAVGGASLGTASGRIVIDTSDLSRASVATQKVGQDVERNLGRINTSASQAGASITKLAGAFGIGLGVAGLVQFGRFVLEVDKLATAYERQSVAARNLAGSQAKLNELLVAYDKATGGAIDKATALADVTALQAVGFADSAAELDKFVTAARGISIATGRQQDYVISQLQLAIANQSTMRLDQIGLGVSEVTARIKELQAADGSLTKEQAYQNAVLGIALEKYGALAKSAAGQATGAEKAAKAAADFRLALGQALSDPVSRGLTELADQINELREVFQGLATDIAAAKKELDKFGGGGQIDLTAALPTSGQNMIGALLQAAGAPGWLTGKEPLFDLSTQHLVMGGSTGLPRLQTRPELTTLGRRTGIGANVREGVFAPPAPGIGAAAAGFTEEQTTVIADHYASLREIEKSANTARLDETRQYEQQRTDTIRQYELSIARDAEDFARSRARQQEQLNKDIADVREEAGRRDAKALQDHEERLAEMRDDSAKRAAEIEEDYARNREKALRDHNNKLQDAASRLDARAIYEEQRRFALQTQDAEEAHKDQLQDNQDALDERTDDENKAYEERLREAKEADDQRIIDMREALVEQQRIEDEDRRIRLERQAQDQALQLAQMDTQHQLRLEQNSTQAAEERTREQEEFNKQLEAQGLHNEAWLKAQKKQEEDSLKLFDEWWKAINQRFGGGIPNSGDAGRPAVPTPFALGGPVLSTGLALLHRGEYVMPAARGSGGRAMSLTVGSIVVNESSRPGGTAAEIRQMLIELVSEAA